MVLVLDPEVDEAAAEAVTRRIDEEHIDTVIAAGCDLNGLLRGKLIPADRFRRSPAAPVPTCDVIYQFDLTDAFIPAPPGAAAWWPFEDGIGDLLAIPDLATFRVVPWLPGTAIVLCDHHQRDGSPLEISPRFVLKRGIERAEALGFVPKMVLELEFFLFEKAGGDGPVPVAARSTAYGVTQTERTAALLRAIRDHAAAFGLPVECTSYEAGAGQFEINLVYSDALLAADRAVFYKHAVRELAARHGFIATFMAKPTADFGSSGHLHQSLWSPEGDNRFFDPAGPHGLSALATSFIAGQLATFSELACLYAPNVNSYKRLLPMSAAPTTVSWAHENRGVALRVVGEGPASVRVENRCPGADANPYLAMAAALTGGLFGIEQNLALPDETRGNPYADPTLEPLPTSLEAAVSAFERSEVARRFLGAQFVDFYAATRRFELEQFRSQPTNWEIQRYLETV